MNKRKTVLQESIIFWENQYRLWVDLGSVGNDGNLMDYFIRHLKSKLPEERQDLIDAHYEGQRECSFEFSMVSDSELYFKNTFENENKTA